MVNNTLNILYIGQKKTDPLKNLLENAYSFHACPELDDATLFLETNDRLIQIILFDFEISSKETSLTFIKQLKKNSPFSEILILSKSNDIYTIITTMKCGVYDILEKPIEPEELQLTIERTLEKFDLTSKIRQMLNKSQLTSLETDSKLAINQQLFWEKIILTDKLSTSDILELFPDKDTTAPNETKLNSIIKKQFTPPPKHLNNCKLLIVEDEADMRECMCDFLSDEYTVHDAEDASSALSILAKHPDISIVLLDIGLPDRSGLDILPLIKSETRDIIIISAYSDKAYAIKAIRDGAYDYIIKPFLKEALLNIVSKTTEKQKYKHLLPKLANILENQTDSYSHRLELLISLFHRRNTQKKSLSINDVYIFFPELEAPPLTTEAPMLNSPSSIRDFIVSIKKRT